MADECLGADDLEQQLYTGVLTMIIGNLDRLTSSECTGWVLDTADPERKLTVELLVQGNVVFSDVANIERVDVGLVHGSSEHGFSFGIDQFLSKARNPIELRVVGEEFKFFDEPVMLASDVRDNVEFGKNGWLFLKNDSNDTVDLVEGRRSLNNDDLNKLVNMLKKRPDDFARWGVTGATYIVPEKSVSLGRLRKSDVPTSDHRPVVQIMSALSDPSRYKVYYPHEFFGPEEFREKLFYKTDTHFSPFGQQVVFIGVMKLLGFHDVQLLEQFPVEHGGDLGLKLDPPVYEQTTSYLVDDCEVVRDEAGDALSNHTTLRGSHIELVNNNPVYDSSILIFGTSSAYYLRWLFAKYFRKVHIYWNPAIVESVVKSVRPDFIVNVLTERMVGGGMVDT